MTTLGLVFVLFGVTVVAVSAGVDLWAGYPGFGPLQIAGIVIGFSLAGLGIALLIPAGRRPIRALAASPLALALYGIVAGLAIVEAGLRLVEVEGGETALFAVEMRELLEPIEDPVLEYRVAPNAAGHDANGFRNARVPVRAEIVALGDSWTWGINARRSETWPEQLVGLTGRSVYNMGMGGYGPAQYWALVDNALAFRPKIVIVGLYLGNDIHNAEVVVYRREAYARFRRPGYAAGNSISDIEQAVGRARRAAHEWQARFMAEIARARLAGWTSTLLAHSATARLLYGLGLWPGTTLKELRFAAAKAWAASNPDYTRVLDAGHFRTILITGQRLAVVDLNDARVREGLSLTKALIGAIDERVRAAGAHLVVVVLPSKELAMAEIYAAEAGALGGIYEKAARMEDRIRREITAFLERRDVPYVDALPVLRGGLNSGIAVFPTNDDSHPTAQGYRLLAEAVKNGIEAFMW